MRARWLILLATLVWVTLTAAAQDSSGVRQSLDDAWWTGPMLAPSAATLPRGHLLIEPYLYDVITQSYYDHSGVRHSTPRANGFGNLTYINYGLLDRLTVGLIPTAGFNTVTGGPNSSGIRMGDLTVQAQYRLTKFSPGHWLPTMSVAVQEMLPTGKYDTLGDRPTNGLGAGVYTTTVAFYAQTYFWLPKNHRILRTRFNVLNGFSSSASVKDVSVYGTEQGFRGHAQPGRSVYIDNSWEYSLTRRWVLATDVTYRHDTNTRVAGYNVLDPAPKSILLDSGARDAFALAPAIEYSWSSKIGILLGVRLFPAGRNTSASITPAIAINYVH
jgi:hypothetical protein